MRTEVPLQPYLALELAAASGLVVRDGRAWVVADDRLALHGYDLERVAPPRVIALDPEQAGDAALRKKLKPDLEALCETGDGRLLALGSGSRPNRSRGFAVDPHRGAVGALDLGPLHAHLRAWLGPLNLEGAVRSGNALLLAHRGLAAGDPSRILVLDAPSRLAPAGGVWPVTALRAAVPVLLDRLDGVQLGFADLALHPRLGLHYLATAERTGDAYTDGEVAGSVFGRLDAEFRPTQLARLRPDLKCEGLAWWKAEGAADHWLVVTDADQPGQSARLLSLRWPGGA